MAGDSGDQWVSARVSIAKATPYRVVFQATRGAGDLSDIALDDVQHSPGACQEGGGEQAAGFEPGTHLLHQQMFYSRKSVHLNENRGMIPGHIPQLLVT